jgi:hypothetical protein
MAIDSDAWKFELEFGRSQGIAETHIGGWCFEMLSRVFNLIPNDEFICQMGQGSHQSNEDNHGMKFHDHSEQNRGAIWTTTCAQVLANTGTLIC